jgi:hypothetical protein
MLFAALLALPSLSQDGARVRAAPCFSPALFVLLGEVGIDRTLERPAWRPPWSCSASAEPWSC